jgi:DNA-binding response OmpR family regulator
MTVLLVDDDADSLELRRLIFAAHGHRVHAAQDPAAAREKFLADPPHAVVHDLRLPSTEDGLALIRAFRALSPTVRLIVLSGWPADLENRPERALVNAVLTKPVRSESLLKALGEEKSV